MLSDESLDSFDTLEIIFLRFEQSESLLANSKKQKNTIFWLWKPIRFETRKTHQKWRAKGDFSEREKGEGENFEEGKGCEAPGNFWCSVLGENLPFDSGRQFALRYWDTICPLLWEERVPSGEICPSIRGEGTHLHAEVPFHTFEWSKCFFHCECEKRCNVKNSVF